MGGNPNEPISPEDTDCTGCGEIVGPGDSCVRYVYLLPIRRVRLGVFHAVCAPEDMDAWLRERAGVGA